MCIYLVVIIIIIKILIIIILYIITEFWALQKQTQQTQRFFSHFKLQSIFIKKFNMQLS